MEDNRVLGAKHGLQSMLYYYLMALSESGVQDPKQYMAKEIPGMIDFSESQAAFVISEINKNVSAAEALKTAAGILRSIEDTGKLDWEAIKLARQVVEEISTQAEKAVKDYVISNNTEKEDSDGNSSRQGKEEKAAGNDSRNQQAVRKTGGTDSKGNAG